MALFQIKTNKTQTEKQKPFIIKWPRPNNLKAVLDFFGM